MVHPVSGELRRAVRKMAQDFADQIATMAKDGIENDADQLLAIAASTLTQMIPDGTFEKVDTAEKHIVDVERRYYPEYEVKLVPTEKLPR